MSDGAVRQLRRGQIVAAARALVARRGLEALTIGALEEELSLSRGLITYHFDGKEEIVEAVLASALEEIDSGTLAQLQKSASVEERLRAVVRSKIDGFLSHPEASRVLLSFWGRLSGDPRARKTNARLYVEYRKQSAKLLRAAGAPARSIEPLAALLVGLVLGIVLQELFDPGAVDAAAAAEEAVQVVLARLRR